MWDYSEEVKKYFLNPLNAGELKDANAIGEVGSLACGDALKLFLKVDPETEVIQAATFQTFGCASAIASSSKLTELVIGKTLDEAIKMTNKDIAGALGGLPRQKMHCSVMGEEALISAIKQYRGEAVDFHQEGDLLCACFGVTDETVIRAIEENDLETVDDVMDFTKAGGGCGDCIDAIEILLAKAHGQEIPAHLLEKSKEEKPNLESLTGLSKGFVPLKLTKTVASQKMTNLQRIQRITEVVEKELRPHFQSMNGDMELIDIEGKNVKFTLSGQCRDCSCGKKSEVKEKIAVKLHEVDTELTFEELL